MPFLSSSPLRRLSCLQRLVAIGAGLFAFGRGEALTVALAERGELRQAVVASGRVRTPQRVEIAAQITGRVAAVAVARLGHATLASPAAGTVLTRTVEPGDSVQPGKLLLTLAPAGESELTA